MNSQYRSLVQEDNGQYDHIYTEVYGADYVKNKQTLEAGTIIFLYCTIVILNIFIIILLCKSSILFFTLKSLYTSCLLYWNH